MYVSAKEKGLALEIYQSLSEKEESFNKIGKKYEKVKYSTKEDGSWVRKIDMKNEIRIRIERMRPEEISKPFLVENKYLITQLLAAKGTSLSEEISEQIITKELNRLLDYGVIQLTEYSLLEHRSTVE